MTTTSNPAPSIGALRLPRPGIRDRARPLLAAVVPVLAVVVVQLVVFPMPLGVWLQGIVIGLLGALMAVGLCLVYRLNRIVNFAQGDLGSAPAVLAVGLVGLSGVNYFLGFLTGLASVLVLTLLVEIVVIRRFARAPRLMLTVVTIGLSQALIVISLLIPNIWGTTPISNAAVHFPWHMTLSVGPVRFTADDLVAVVVSVAALAGVGLWFRFTSVGIATRAAGDRRDRAAMLGIPVNQLQTITWLVAGVLSFFSIFFKAAILGLPLDPTFSLTALIAALAALALGGFTNLPAVAAAAVAIGTLTQGVAWDHGSQPTLVLAVLAAVVLGGMFLSQLFRASGARDSAAQWALASGVRETPAVLAKLGEVRAAKLSGGVVVLGALATLPLWLGPGTLLEMSTLLVLAIVGCSIVLLTGWAGQVSLGQMSFAAVGAVFGAVALLDWHLDLSLAILIAGAAAGVVALLVGIPTLRLDGVFVAVTTLAFGLAVSTFLLDRAQFSWIPGGTVLSPRLFGVPLSSETSLYLTCLGVGLLVVIAMMGLRHSRFGRVLRAQSTNPKAVASFGADVSRATLMAFLVSGFIAGIAGCLLLTLNQQYVETPYVETASLAVFTATAVGGLGSVLGAVAGAALIEGSAVFLPPSWQLFPSALGVIIVLMAFPGGLSALAYDARDRLLDLVARRRGLSVPGITITAASAEDAEQGRDHEQAAS